MKKNNTAETAKKGQTATNSTTVNNPEAKRAAREKQYREFRIAALRRRCKRNKVSAERTEELVKALIEQFDKPTTYDILIMYNTSDKDIVRETLTNEKINWQYLATTYGKFVGDKAFLDKLRSIMPDGVKIYPYAKKMEPVDKVEREAKQKKPTNNTTEVRKIAKTKRKSKNTERFFKQSTKKGKVPRWLKKSRNVKMSLKQHKNNKAKKAA